MRRLRDVRPTSSRASSCAIPSRRSTRGDWDYDVPMLAGDHVTDDAGTGFVHTAPCHGDDDYELVREERPRRRMTHNVLEDCVLRPARAASSAGCRSSTPRARRATANTAVIDKLIEAGALLARGRLKHCYPHSWRSKAPVIYRNTPQWFVAIDKPLGDGMDTYGRHDPRAGADLDRPARQLDAADRAATACYSMIEARPDWVLSRQRAWGVPLTCFVEAPGRRRRRDPARPGGQRPHPATPSRPRAPTPGTRTAPRSASSATTTTRRTTRRSPTSSTSGSTPARPTPSCSATAPTDLAGRDLYLEGTDQHRGWFHSSMLQACGTRGRAPYDGVLTHGFTLDENGQKMSKSLGNTVAPEDGHQAVRRRHPAPLGGAVRLHRRPAHRARRS